MSDQNSQGAPGPSTDANNDPVTDPTRNVLDLVGAAIQRQDDLREYNSDHIKEILDLRSHYMEKLQAAESARIDAIRAVDVGAVNRAAEVATTQAQTLATQVQVSAETLRTQVAAAAGAATVALAAALEPVQKDIADLRRAQYEAQGQKTQVVDAQQKSAGLGQWIGIFIAAIAALVAIVAVIVVVNKAAPAPVTCAPQGSLNTIVCR